MLTIVRGLRSSVQRIDSQTSRWGRATLAFAAGALVSGAVTAIALAPTHEAGTGERGSPPAAGVPRMRPAPTATLDHLRSQAAAGDELASWNLATTLLNRYDTTANPEELYEALVWVDRLWDKTGKVEMAERITARYCMQRVARWHWICSLGE